MIRRITIVAFVGSLGLALAEAGSGRWTTSGPRGGTGGISFGVRVLALDPQTPSTLYAGTLKGLFKSADRAANWTRVEDDLVDRISVLAVDPQTPALLYSLEEFNVLKSSDGGETWMSMSPGLEEPFGIDFLVIDPLTPSTLYAAAGNDIVKSTDGAVSWVSVNGGLPDESIFDLVIDPQAPTTLYAAAGSSGVFKSTDGAASWTPASPVFQARAVAVDPQTPTTVYAGTEGEGVFKSIDGGVTWTAIGTGLPSGAGLIGLGISIGPLVIDPQTPTTLYAGVDEDPPACTRARMAGPAGQE